MGVIKDGTISRVLPGGTQGFLVNYPGYPSSMPRAIDTLGGIQPILKARSSLSNKLELRFRPEDPHSHLAFGELHPCNNLLLKISKIKPSECHDSEASDNVVKCKRELGTHASPQKGERLAMAREVEDGMPTEAEANL